MKMVKQNLKAVKIYIKIYIKVTSQFVIGGWKYAQFRNIIFLSVANAFIWCKINHKQSVVH